MVLVGLVACEVRAPEERTSVALPSHSSTPAASTEACTADNVKTLVSSFIRAFNAGDQGALERLWAQPATGWDWFSTDGPDPRINAVADNRDSLAAFFARRHAKREKLRLTMFKFNGITDTVAGGNFEFTVTRSADDLKPTLYVGKGAAVCTAVPMTIGVWSMARDPYH